MKIENFLDAMAGILHLLRLSSGEWIYVVCVFLLVRWIVAVCAAREQFSSISTPKYLPFDRNPVGLLWSILSLAILLFRFFSLIFNQLADAEAPIPLDAVNAWCEQHPCLSILLNFLFPVPSSIMESILAWRRLWGMLFAYLLIEFIAHKELKEKLGLCLGRYVSFPRWFRNLLAKLQKKRPHTERDLHIYDHRTAQQRDFLREEHKWLRVFYPLAVLLVMCLNMKNEENPECMLFPLLALTEFWIEVSLPTYKELHEKQQQQDDLVERQDEFYEILDALQIKDKNGELAGNCRPFSTRPLFRKRETPPDASGEQTHEEKLVAYYLSICDQAGENVSPELAPAAAEMLMGKSVVFSTRFYQDIDYAFYLPMLRTLQKGCHCLIVAGDPIAWQPLADWLMEGKRHIPGDPAVWKMKRCTADGWWGETDIGYLTAEDLGDLRLLNENSAFLQNVQLVLLINASSLLHKQLFGILRLRKKLHPDAVFAICNDNAVGLTDIYSHLLQTDLTLVYPTTRAAERGLWMFFDEEEPAGADVLSCHQYMLGNILLSQTSDTIGEVRWYSKWSSPVKDFSDLLGMVHSADEHDTAKQRAGRIVLGTEDANCPQTDFSCVMVEDEICNPAELSIQFASRGRKGAIAAVFSPYYFFRDYIRANIETFQKNVRRIAQTFPAYCMTERNAVLQMLWNMEREPLNENDIHMICTLLGQVRFEQELQPQGYVDQQRLEKKFRVYTGIPNPGYYLHCEHKYEHGMITRTFWLDPLPERCYDIKRPCFYICAAFGVGRRPLQQYSRVQLAQNYLPGQIVSLDGHAYEVMDIIGKADSVEMYVRKSAQNARLRTYYRQKRTVTVGGGIGVSGRREALYTRSFSFPTVADRTIELRRYRAGTMEVETAGYWTLTGARDGEVYTALSPEQREAFTHMLYQKEFLCIVFSGPSDSSIAHTLMFDLSEMFRTIYAEYAPQLLVCKSETEASGARVAMENFGLDEEQQPPQEHFFYVIEDSEEDIGLLDSITSHFERILGVISEAESWMGRNSM